MIVSILMQKGVEGLGTVFGGSVNQSFRTKRGFEAFIFNVTIFTGVMFVANALAIVILSSS
jgi:protein translocase SecG subunit